MGDCPTEMLHQKMLPAHLDGDQDVANYRLSGLILVPGNQVSKTSRREKTITICSGRQVKWIKIGLIIGLT